MILIFSFLAFASAGFCYQISAYSDRIVYLPNETVTISGTINYSGPDNVTAYVYNSSESLLGSNTSSVNNTFSAHFYLENFSEGEYYSIIKFGSDSVKINFKVVESIISLEAHLIADDSVTGIDTDVQITSPGDIGGNFSDLLSLNRTSLYYGNQTIGGFLYHFVILDPNYDGVFDTVYADDDKNFMLYNYTEDNTNVTEYQSLGKGSFMKINGSSYIVGDMEYSTGNRLIIARPANSSVYTAGSIVYFTVLAKSSGNFSNNTVVNVTLWNSSSTSGMETKSGTTNEFGYFVSNFTAPSSPGIYTISLNSEPGEVFFVESFSLKAMVTDESNNPMASFAPGSKIRIRSVSKTSQGNSFNLSGGVYVSIACPNGSIINHTMSIVSEGVYSYNLSSESLPNGQYMVKVVGINGTDAQSFTTGFSVDSVGTMVFAFNPDYMDQVEKGGPGFSVSSFAPDSNATIMVLLINISAGGISSDGPPAVVDIDDFSTPEDECNTRIQLLELKDELGVSYLNNITYNSTNISTAMSIFNITEQEGEIPDELKRQCVLRIEGLAKKGIYRAKIKISHPLGEKISGSTFSIQRLHATGDTVDFKGEDFSFFAPNETVRIKLKITDLLTRQQLSAENITDAKIISLQQEFPVYQDVFPLYMSTLNESISNGTLVFNSPSAEGVYTMKFRFKANLSGQTETGIGTASFMLKKYLIWSETGSEGKWFIKQGENITLTVNIVDISQGSKMDMGMSSGLSCTGCEGLIANVTKMWNDQLMIEIPSSEYNVSVGNVINSTSGASITIIPNSVLPTGWYGVDLSLYNPENPNETYTGWGGFEIRNFFVDMISIEVVDGNLTASPKAGPGSSFEVNSSVTFAIIPRIPGDWESMIPVNATSVSLESVSWFNSWPPAKLNASSSVSLRNVSIEMGPDIVQVPLWIVNITGLDKTGQHQANVIVNVNGSGSDIGSFFFDMSRFNVYEYYRGMYEWPAYFSKDENFTINFTACDFGSGCTPHNISNITIERVFNMKQDMPTRGKDLAYGFECPDENNCTLSLNLTNFTNGMYSLEIKILDNLNNSKSSEIEFMIKDIIIAIPSIERAWFMTTDTPSLEITIENDRDICSNEKWLGNDAYVSSDNVIHMNDEMVMWTNLFQDSCPRGTDTSAETNTTVCSNGNSTNFTMGFDKTGDFFSAKGCLYDNGTLSAPFDYFSNVCYGTNVSIVTNATYIWIGSSGDGNVSVVDMASVSPNSTGDNATLGIRNWTITNAFNNTENITQYVDMQLVRVCWPGSPGGCADISMDEKPVSPKAAALCVNHTYSPNQWGNDDIPSCGDEIIYIVSNSTQAWISNDTDFTSASPKSSGDSFNASGISWTIIDIGRDQNGNTDMSKARLSTSQRYGIAYFEMWNMTGPVNVSLDVIGKYSRNYVNGFCVKANGEWMDGFCDQGQGMTQVYVFANSTHIWAGNETDLTLVSAVAANETFSVGGRAWILTEIGGSGQTMLKVRAANNGVCGNSWVCGDQGPCNETPYTIYMDSNYSSSYHGYLRLSRNDNSWLGEAFDNSRYVYAYHNTTHLWFSDYNDTNFTDNPSDYGNKTKGQVIKDPYGGEWNITLINKRSVILSGVNVMAGTGAYVQTNLSRSGIFKIGRIEESQLGAWDKNNGDRAGLDIDGDGFKNGSIYIMISDNQTSGIYDTFFYSEDNNFTNSSNIISLNSNRESRTFGSGANLTLLSIPPTAGEVILYSDAVGDWADLGQFVVGRDITIPVIVKSPSGVAVEANVSVPFIRTESTNSITYLTGAIPNASITGIGEVVITNASYVQTGNPVGEFTFGIEVNISASSELLEDWKLPRATTRAFLSDLMIGRGWNLPGFSAMTLWRYDWENYNEIPEVQSMQILENNYTAVMENMQYGMTQTVNDSTCSDFSYPPGAGEFNITYMSSRFHSPQYYFFASNGSIGTVWIKQGDCNFSSAEAFSASTGEQANLSIDGRMYMLYVLYANMTDLNFSNIVIGLYGVNETEMLPLSSMDIYPTWKLMAANLSGDYYDILISNDTYDYPMCSIWNMQQCAKKAWFSATGNFSDAVGVRPGENFTSNLYLSKIGPGPWDGLIIGDFSNISSMYPGLPAIDVRSRDNSPAYFAVLDESSLGMDLNMNPSENNTYYIIAFDDREDSQQQMTHFKLDDDLQISDDFWGNHSNPADAYYVDFDCNETGMRESWSSLPTTTNKGSVLFGERNDYENVSYENKPEWEIAKYNNTNMIIEKGKWWNNLSDEISIVVRVYNFDQSPLSGANISVSKITRFTPFGSLALANGTDYNITTGSPLVADSDGYALIRINPLQAGNPGDWQEGEYMVALNMQYSGENQTSYEWFRVSSSDEKK